MVWYFLWVLGKNGDWIKEVAPCVCVCVCVCVCARAHMCVCMCVTAHACMCVGAHVCICLCMYVCMCVHVCACMCVCLCARTHVCMCAFMCVHMCAHTRVCACVCVHVHACVCLIVPDSCGPLDCSPPDSSLHGVSIQGYWSWLPFPHRNKIIFCDYIWLNYCLIVTMRDYVQRRNLNIRFQCNWWRLDVEISKVLGKFKVVFLDS